MLLNVTSQYTGGLAIISRSESRSCAVEIGFSMFIIKILVSSAICLIFDSMFFTTSFISRT